MSRNQKIALNAVLVGYLVVVILATVPALELTAMFIVGWLAVKYILDPLSTKIGHALMPFFMTDWTAKIEALTEHQLAKARAAEQAKWKANAARAEKKRKDA